MSDSERQPPSRESTQDQVLTHEGLLEAFVLIDKATYDLTPFTTDFRSPTEPKTATLSTLQANWDRQGLKPQLLMEAIAFLQTYGLIAEVQRGEYVLTADGANQALKVRKLSAELSKLLQVETHPDLELEQLLFQYLRAELE